MSFRFKSTLLVFVASVLIQCSVYSQVRDTVIYCFKYGADGSLQKTSKDNCDFIRMIFPATSGNQLVDIKEFYRDGKTKLVGKSKPDLLASGIVKLQGTCISYYSNGSRQSIASYEDNAKIGLDYEYYRNSRLYCIYKCSYDIMHNKPTTTYIECHDVDGTIICKEGNGNWIMYDDNQRVKFRGRVLNSLKEGEWAGGMMLQSDSVKYTCIFRRNIFVSGVGYGKDGKSYPYTKEFVGPFDNELYGPGPISLIEKFRRNIKFPKQMGAKIDIDTLKISFVIEPNGTLSNFATVNKIDIPTEQVLATAFSNCTLGWEPRRVCGVPLRSKIIASVKLRQPMGNLSRIKSVDFTEEILGQ